MSSRAQKETSREEDRFPGILQKMSNEMEDYVGHREEIFPRNGRER